MKYTSIHEYFMLNIDLLYINFFFEYGLGLLFANVAIYLFVLALFFSIFFFFDLRYFRTLNEIKGLNSYNFIIMGAAFSLLSLAGMPPLLGFVGKFLLLIFLSYKNQFLLFLLFGFINLFMIYFYVQNIRFLVRNTQSNILVIRHNFVNIDLRLVSIVVFLNFFNIFGIFFFEDFLILINY
jgi:NADH:ubiquinone oxidoreductase subunit 2 (subunit N)